MRVFITAAGMVGCHAARELVQRGDEVTFYDIAPRPEYIQRVVQGDVRVVRGDVRELPSLLEAIQQARPDVVIHTAAFIGGAAQANPYRGFQTNVGGTINVAEAVRLAGVRRLLHMSTLGVNDLSAPQTKPLAEDFPVDGGDRVYGASKVACEQILRAYAFAYRFELGMLRLAGVYGYGHFTGGSSVGIGTFELVRAAAEGREAVIGPGIPDPNEVIYAKDVGRGIALAAHAERLPHHTYNLGTGVLVSHQDLIDALQRVVPGARIRRPEQPPTDRLKRLQPFDTSRARQELGFEAQYSLEAGLRDLLAEIQRDQA